MTSSNGNNFRVTGPLRWVFTGHRWIPRTNASDAELWCYLWSVAGQFLEQTLETPDLRRQRAQNDVTGTYQQWKHLTLKTDHWHNTNFVVAGDITGCQSDNLWWHHWRRLRYHDNSLFSVNAKRQTTNMSRAFVGNKIVDHSDVVGASSTPTISSFST